VFEGQDLWHDAAAWLHEGFRRFENVLNCLASCFETSSATHPWHSITLQNTSMLFLPNVGTPAVTSTPQAWGSKFLRHIGDKIGKLPCSGSKAARNSPVSFPGLRRAEIIIYRLKWAFLSLLSCIVNMEAAGSYEILVQRGKICVVACWSIFMLLLCASPWTSDILYIHIYIYIERERERERLQFVDANIRCIYQTAVQIGTLTAQICWHEIQKFDWEIFIMETEKKQTLCFQPSGILRRTGAEVSEEIFLLHL
jgi:hypothetical protein